MVSHLDGIFMNVALADDNLAFDLALAPKDCVPVNPWKHFFQCGTQQLTDQLFLSVLPADIRNTVGPGCLDILCILCDVQTGELDPLDRYSL